MEKMGVVRPDITPQLEDADTAKSAANCTKPDIVDNCTAAIKQLDDDFSKKAAEQVTKNLHSR